MTALDLFQILLATYVLSTTGAAACRIYAMRASSREHQDYLERVTAKAWCAGCNTIWPAPLMGWTDTDLYRCPDCQPDKETVTP